MNKEQLSLEMRSHGRLVVKCSFFMLALLLVGWAATQAVVYTVMLKNTDIFYTVNDFIGQLAESLDVFAEDGGLSMAGLLINNLRATAIMTVCGFIPFLLVPVFQVAINGGLLGVVGAYATFGGASFMGFLMSILPHGIFELPALSVAAGLGIGLCVELSKRITHSKPVSFSFGRYVIWTLKWYALTVAPLLVAAAFIEAFVTMGVAERFM